MSSDGAGKKALQGPQPEPTPKASDTTGSIQDPKAREAKHLQQGDWPANPPESVAKTLLPKLLRTTRMLLASQSFFFSYDLDITRRIDNQSSKGSELPLHQSVDPLVSHVVLFIESVTGC